MKRRRFLALPAALAAARTLHAEPPIRKAVYAGMLPRQLNWMEKFAVARAAGFEAVECDTASEPQTAVEIKRAAEAAGVRIHSVMNQAHWKFPLSSGDSKVVAEGLKGMETSLRNASLWGADTVLLVPAVVDARTSYRDAYERSRKNVQTLLPLARQLKVIIAIENVWNKFLLTPLEFAAYVDSFKSPWLRAYFDVGNIALYGFPQDWIRILGKRIVKLHLKDFSFRKNVAAFTALGEGDLDWPAIRQALTEIGYSGYATCELPSGDEEYLKEVGRRVDRLLLVI
jgi:hexulose-6-phosphate isomerase